MTNTPRSQPTPPSEETLSQGHLIPRYDAADQFTVADLDTAYPEWRDNHDASDPELVAMDFVRTQELRRLSVETGQSFMGHGGGEGLEKALDMMPHEVGWQYDAHGIAGKSGSSSTELYQLLQNGIDPNRLLYSMNLLHNPEAMAMGADGPITQGGLIVVSERNEKLSEGIKYVLVGEEYVKVLDMMQGRFPAVKFITWHDAPQFFTDQVNRAEGTNYKPNEIEHPDTYTPPVENTELPDYRALGHNVTDFAELGHVASAPPPSDADDVW